MNNCPNCKTVVMEYQGSQAWRCPSCSCEDQPLDLNVDEAIAQWLERDRMKKGPHGGYRPGAGKKAKRGPTKVIRIPEAYESAVLSLITFLDSTRAIGRGYAACESEPQFIRSLDLKPQHVSFRVAPVHK